MNSIKVISKFSLIVIIISILSCQKDGGNNDTSSRLFNNDEIHLSSNDHIANFDLLNELELEIDFFQNELTPNYEYSKIIDIENVDETHIYIPLMNINNEMVDLFLAIKTTENLSYQYFSNSNENKIKNNTYDYFYSKIVNQLVPNHSTTVYKIVELNYKTDDVLCTGNYIWYELVSTLIRDDGSLNPVEYVDQLVNIGTITYPCNGDGGPVFTDGEDSVGGPTNSDPDADDDFDVCLKLLNQETITDIEAAEKYHANCGCEGFMMRSITMAEINEAYNFFQDLDADGVECPTFNCGINILNVVKSLFSEITTPCNNDEIDYKLLYKSAIEQNEDCSPTRSDLFEVLDELTNGAYIVKSNFGNASQNVIGNELIVGLNLLTNSDDCTYTNEEIVNILPEAVLCELSSLSGPHTNIGCTNAELCEILSDLDESNELEELSELTSLNDLCVHCKESYITSELVAGFYLSYSECLSVAGAGFVDINIYAEWECCVHWNGQISVERPEYKIVYVTNGFTGNAGKITFRDDIIVDNANQILTMHLEVILSTGFGETVACTRNFEEKDFDFKFSCQ